MGLGTDCTDEEYNQGSKRLFEWGIVINAKKGHDEKNYCLKWWHNTELKNQKKTFWKTHTVEEEKSKEIGREKQEQPKKVGIAKP